MYAVHLPWALLRELTSSPTSSRQFAASSLIALGGLIGFLTKQSLPSLMAGGGLGALLAYGVQRQRANPRDVGLIVGASTSYELACFVPLLNPNDDCSRCQRLARRSDGDALLPEPKIHARRSCLGTPAALDLQQYFV